MANRPESRFRPYTFRLGAAVGTMGALAYSSFLLEALFHTGLSPLNSYVSELSVPGRPHPFLFRTGDVTAGCGLLVLAMALARCLPARRPRTGGCVALAVAAAASITDGLWPMSCAPSVDRVCRASDRADLGQQLRQVHTLSSLAEFTGAILAMLLLSAVLHRTGHRHPARWSLAAGVLVAALGTMEIAMVLTGLRWVGLPERVQILLVSVWCAAMAYFPAHAPPAPAARRDAPASLDRPPSRVTTEANPADHVREKHWPDGRPGHRACATDGLSSPPRSHAHRPHASGGRIGRFRPIPNRRLP